MNSSAQRRGCNELAVHGDLRLGVLGDCVPAACIYLFIYLERQKLMKGAF